MGALETLLPAPGHVLLGRYELQGTPGAVVSLEGRELGQIPFEVEHPRLGIYNPGHDQRPAGTSRP
jgi:hypothetical protein